MSPKQVKVGVFVPNDTMILDTAAVDLLGMGSKEYTSEIPFLPAHISSIAPSLSFAYIAPGKLIPMTPSAKLQATHDLSHPDVQPGKLDILLVPGVAPDAEFVEEALAFLRGHAEAGTDVLSICTGILICAAAGITDGKRACGPRGMQDVLRKRFPGANFVGEEYRWVQDGNIWTSGELMIHREAVLWDVANVG